MQKKVLIGLIVAIVVFVVVAVATYTLRPTTVVDRAVKRLGEVSTAVFEAVLVLENSEATQRVLGEEGAVELTVDGSFDRRGEAADALAAHIELATHTDSVSVAVDGSTRFIDDEIYLFIDKAPQVFPVLVMLKGQWLQFARGNTANTPTDTLPEDIFKEVDRVGTEDIEGVSTVHYTAIASANAVVRMMDGMAQVLGTRLTEQQIAEIQESAKAAGDVSVDVWVKRFSRDLQRFSTILAVPGGNTVRFTLTIKERDVPVTIEVPPGAVTLQEAVKKIQSAPAP